MKCCAPNQWQLSRSALATPVRCRISAKGRERHTSTDFGGGLCSSEPTPASICLVRRPLAASAAPPFATQGKCDWRDAGVTVGFASITGGEPPTDPGSMGEAGNRRPSVQRFLDDQSAKDALHASRAISEVDPDEYDLVFLPSGHGTMWDFRQSDALARIVGRIFDRGAMVGAVCHGPAGLIEAKTADGTPIVSGRRINSFTDAEEAAVGLVNAVPFLVESSLREKGGLFEGTDTFGSHAVRDGNLITGQNPASVEAVADLLVEAIKATATTAA